MTVKDIDVTRGQYMMLYGTMCEHNQMINPQMKSRFRFANFDNLFLQQSLQRRLIYENNTKRKN